MGQVVDGEAIDHPGDLDTFTLATAPGQLVNLIFRVAEDAEGEFFLRLYPPGAAPDSPPPYMVLGMESRTLDAVSTGRLTLQGGTYRITVTGDVPGGLQTDGRGRYAFVVRPVRLAPEEVPAALVVGDT